MCPGFEGHFLRDDHAGEYCARLAGKRTSQSGWRKRGDLLAMIRAAT
jgi:hypothetical protein